VLGAIGGVNESDIVSSGSEVFSYETDFGKIGIEICYDLRFPELARTLALRGVQFLFVPAAFYSPRSDHWQGLLKATALQNSMYVLGANLYGKLNDRNIFCGRSTIADPWGVQIATASDKPGIVHAYIESSYACEVRDSVGTLLNRAPEVYDIH
jgi:predicted amidohydrolase